MFALMCTTDAKWLAGNLRRSHVVIARGRNFSIRLFQVDNAHGESNYRLGATVLLDSAMKGETVVAVKPNSKESGGRALVSSMRTTINSPTALLLHMVGLAMCLGLTIFFHARHMPLYDYSFLTTVSYRLSLGQVPYRDFVLPIVPGAFYVLALAYLVLGWTSKTLLIVTLASAVAGYILVLDISRLVDPRLGLRSGHVAGFAIWLAAILSGVCYNLALPFYDNLAVIAVMLSLDTILRVLRRPGSLFAWLIAGVSLLMPALFKQNIGGFYFIGVVLAFCITILVSPQLTRRYRLSLTTSFLGLCLVGSAGILLLISLGLTRPFIEQVVLSAGQGKSVLSLTQLHPYISLSSFAVVTTAFAATFVKSNRWTAAMWAWPWILIGFLSACSLLDIAILNPSGYTPSFARPLEFLPALVVSGFALSLVTAVRSRKSLTVASGLGIVLSSAIAGALLSQGAWGSSYALGPLIVLLATPYLVYCINAQAKLIVLVTAAGLIGFSLWFVSYAATGDRLRFVDAFSEPQGFGQPGSALSFTSMSGSSRQAMEDLKSVLSQMPQAKLLEIPMEDPLPFIAPTHTPWWRCDQANVTTCPEEAFIAREFLDNPPDVVILKEKPQLLGYKEVEPKAIKLAVAIRSCYSPNFVISDRYSIFTNLQPNDCLRNAIGQSD